MMISLIIIIFFDNDYDNKKLFLEAVEDSIKKLLKEYFQNYNRIKKLNNLLW